MEYNKELIPDTIDNLKLKRDKYSKVWVDKFHNLSYVNKKKVISHLEKAQEQYIIDMMKDINLEIKVHKLGRFIIKKARYRFYELRDKYPDKLPSEIKDMVVKEYIEEAESNKNK